MTNKIRVRFAPSPTGHLHVGGARTALFNWLFARNRGGTFILRIEDTDQTRNSQEAVDAIIEGMRWLGMDWDEGPKAGGAHGPYLQTQRLELYKKYADLLLAEGKAYYCYCTPEELDAERKAASQRKEAPKYSSKCRALTQEQRKKYEAEGRKTVLRFRLPMVGKTEVDDLAHGKVTFENEFLDDFVIMKSDGFPTYNFAAVVDDHLMEITHIIRGDDHLSNTPRQILLYHAFGWELPKFAHIPMILGKDKARMSKRHGATSIIAYQEMGYLPEAMLNYLARLGWGHGDQEIFSREELIKFFSLDKVNKTSAVFDIEKLNWLNGHYIRQILPERLVDLCLPFLTQRYPIVQELERTKEGMAYIKKVVMCLQDRLKLTCEIADLTEYFFADNFQIDQKAKEKYFNKPEVPEILKTLKERLEKIDPFTAIEIEQVFKSLALERNCKLGEIIHPTRFVLTGRAESPGIYVVVEVLGKQKVLSRLTSPA